MGVQPVDVDDGAVDLSKFIQKSTLNELLAVAQEAMDSGDGAPMRRRMVQPLCTCPLVVLTSSLLCDDAMQVEVSNVSKVYLHSLHQGDGIGFSKKKLSKSSSSKLSVWVRLQIMRSVCNCADYETP